MKILIIILICSLLILSGCSVNRWSVNKCISDCRQCNEDQFCTNNSDTNYKECFEQSSKVCLNYGIGKQEEGVK